ncbi:MAG: bifunctional aspartate kinase/homoserine dehydrogenase I [Alistipes sp.]|jgi:aspartokinase/homoserine dehydrogenase 1|nr:bifunctional aspartate kinase/homoserine dehydrogenase I [Alistipes sp.]
MKIMKFGGSSVGSAQAAERVKNIVCGVGEDVVVVVSALAGVTDGLLEIAHTAHRGDETYENAFSSLASRHTTQMDATVLPEKRAETEKAVAGMLDELGNILRGVYLIRDLSPRTRDTVVSYGERLSATMVAGMIPGAELMDARAMIKTHPYFSKHVVDLPLTEKLVREAFNHTPRIAVMGGFIASDADTGDATTLGRGGSDYTGALVAAALNASILEIWTDVDGFMSADPRVIDNTYLIERLTFSEAMELCNFGARVLLPSTIFPVYQKNIPIRVRNTFNPESPGTLISSASEKGEKIIKGLSSINDTCLITVKGLGMVGVIGVNYRIFKALSRAGISVFFVSQASSESSTSIGVRHEDGAPAIRVLSEEFATEIRQGEINEIIPAYDLATVAVVGENMRGHAGVSAKLFDTLGRSGINVISCAQGALETNVSFVIAAPDLRKALNALHDAFLLWDYQVLNLFIAGVGTVGRSLLEQIHSQQPKFLKDNSLQVRVVGIANSRRHITNRAGIDLAHWREILDNEGEPSTTENYRDAVVGMNIFNPVFVDCTASESIAATYRHLLNHNVSVVAANKVAASGDYDNYLALKEISRKRGAKFLFETNVGAGLPIIKTIGDLVGSGDRILRIEAVVSGTLNFIFNEMGPDLPLSAAIKKAVEAGFAEPDPRIDLSGKDVMRTLVILSRDAGYRISHSDIEARLFIPERYFEGTLDQFWATVPELDADFERRRKELADKGLRWRFVAEMSDGRASVSLREVDNRSPFYDLNGTGNVILLTTERYKDYPMEIKGYGAGADVTAAGVFADIISLANVR